MYLHDFGEDAASFTKEEMSQGYIFSSNLYKYISALLIQVFFISNRKHLEYESKLIETVLHIPRNLQNIDSNNILNYNWNNTNTTNTSTTATNSSNSLTNGTNSNGTSLVNTNTNTNNNSNTVNSNNYDNKNEIKMRYYIYLRDTIFLYNEKIIQF